MSSSYIMEALNNNLKLYSLSEAAKLLGIGRDTLKSLIAKGRIGYIKTLKNKKISHLELERFIKESIVKVDVNLSDSIITNRDIEHFLNGSKRNHNLSTDKIFEAVFKETING